MKWSCLLPLLAINVSASTLCIGPSATGGGTGTDWSNIKAWSGTPVRGDTWYLQDGTYTGKTLSVAISGTTRITIKKATIADHVTDTGWVSTMGDGQANFTGALIFNSGYWTVDGQAGAGDGSVTAYGFSVLTGQGSSACDMEGTSGTHLTNIIVQYCELAGVTNLGDFTYTSGTKPLVFSFTDNCTAHHCYIHGGESLIDTESGGSTAAASTGISISNCICAASRSIAASFHANVAYMTACSFGVFANNLVYNYNAEGFFVTGFEATVTDWKIYGNVFYSTGAGEDSPRGIELRQDYSYQRIVAINNTFVNLGTGGYMDRTAETGNTCSGCAATNNLSYGSPNEQGNSTFSNNTDDSVNRFVSLAGFDFRLTAGLAGLSLAAPYNVDVLGNTRAGDGTWDRGAYEYGAALSSTVLTVSGTVNIGGKVNQ